MLRNVLITLLVFLTGFVSSLPVFAAEAIADTANKEAVADIEPPANKETAAKQDAPTQAQENTFNIFEFKVLGNTVLPIEKIEEAVYAHLGEKRTIGNVEAARTDLEKAYHTAGYLTVLVTIPEQKVDEGVVKLSVTESTVDKLRITGSRYFTLGKIKEGVPEMAEGKTPHFPTVQKQLAALNRSPDRRITPVLKAGRAPGTLAVELKVEDKLPLHGSIGINDRYSADTSRWRAAFNLHYDNLWQLQHSINLTWLTAPKNTDESTVFAGTYSIPLDSGDYLALYGVHSESDVAAVNTLNVVGNGNIIGLRYIHPLPSKENFYHNLTLGVDYKDFDQTINLLGGDTSASSPISYLPFVLNWDGVWSGESSTTKLGISFNKHIRDLVGKDGIGNEFDNKRFKARADYAYLRSNIEQSWRFKNGSHFDLRFNGQLTDQPLISNEQFSIGGADTVRGYLESEVLGDKGYVANIEFHSPSFGKHLNEKISDLHALAFIDFGKVITINPQALQREKSDIASAGFGVRLNVYNFNATLDYAKALKDGASLRTEEGDDRLHVGLEYTF